MGEKITMATWIEDTAHKPTPTTTHPPTHTGIDRKFLSKQSAWPTFYRLKKLVTSPRDCVSQHRSGQLGISPLQGQLNQNIVTRWPQKHATVSNSYEITCYPVCAFMICTPTRVGGYYNIMETCQLETCFNHIYQEKAFHRSIPTYPFPLHPPHLWMLWYTLF